MSSQRFTPWCTSIRRPSRSSWSNYRRTTPASARMVTDASERQRPMGSHNGRLGV